MKYVLGIDLGTSGTKTVLFDQQGKGIRQERYAGAMQRSFYVGTALKAEDVRAKFEDGILCTEDGNPFFSHI